MYPSSKAAYIRQHFKQFCRLCLQNNKGKDNKFKKLLKNELLCTDFHNIFGTKLSPDENLPDNICKTCYKLLPGYLRFHKKCLTSQRQLQAIKLSLKEEEPETFEPKQSVDEILQIIKPLPKEEVEDDKMLIPKIEISDEDEKEKFIPSPVIAEPKVKKIYYRKAQQCTECGKVVKRLDCHMLQHLTDVRYICHFCDRKIVTKGNLIKHLRTHLKIKNFKCHLCIKDFVSSSELKIHVVMHSGSRDHKCDLCDKSFNRQSILMSHKKRVHFKQARIICEICHVKFYIPFHYRQHMRTTHAERPKCQFCSKAMKNQKSLEIHLRTHTGLSEFVCSTCGRTCANRISLLRHQKCHENTKGRNHIACMKNARLQNIGLQDFPM